jgi:predicted nuclease of restriction endonuclease-like RecB superfamily
LSALLERDCEFQSGSSLNGRAVRSFLFNRGLVVYEEEREQSLGEASTHFGVSKQELEEAIFSDLQEEQILISFHPPLPDEILKKYNLALTQALLFDALELECQVEGNYQPIFRQIKYLGLMYEINDVIKITGPASLFKKNKKYGVSFAKLLPIIIAADKWVIKAKVETQIGGEPRLLNFALDSESGIPLPVSPISFPHFDSEVEAQFYHEFKSLNTRWEIRREPEIIKAGNFVFIPDFGFYTNGLKHYLEIVGFWTPDYLQKKITKIRDAHLNITVAVNETLRCRKEDFPGAVIFYTKKIPLSPITKILRDLEDQQFTQEREKFNRIQLVEEIVPLKEKARELKTHPDVLRRLQIPDHYIIGEYIVSQHYLNQVKEELTPHSQDYPKIEEILGKYHLTSKALELMGYKIIWEGLKPKKIVKK